jgi:hypothetical protein
MHLHRCELLWAHAKRLGYCIKLNTVVGAVNVDDDMSDLVLRLQPDRWKVFKVLPKRGQNDGSANTGVMSMVTTACCNAGSRYDALCCI